MFLLDTDTIIYSLKNDPTVIANLKLNRDAPKAISAITYGELAYGAEKSKNRHENLAKVHRIAEIFPVIDVTPAILDTYGAVKADLERQGVSIDEFDLIIGATAMTFGYRVVTNNEKHFSKIPGLRVENWSK